MIVYKGNGEKGETIGHVFVRLMELLYVSILSVDQTFTIDYDLKFHKFDSSS